MPTVKEFSDHLETNWENLTDELKNIFLSILFKRIDLKHNPATITANVTWCTGLVQTIEIERLFVDTRTEWRLVASKEEGDPVGGRRWRRNRTPPCRF